MSSNIKYNLEITENKIVTPLYYTNTITPEGKIERTINNLTFSDGIINIGIDKIGILKTVFANSTDMNLHFSTNASSFTIPINGQFMWEVTDAFSSGVVSCGVSTNSLTAIDATLTLIGVA